jgi:hypothetical protein
MNTVLNLNWKPINLNKISDPDSMTINGQDLIDQSSNRVSCGPTET